MKAKSLFLTKLLVLLLLTPFAQADTEASAESSPQQMSKLRYATSGVVGTYAGFGLGHTIQGRWSEIGYKMTLGQVGGLGLMLVGTIDCSIDAIDNDDCEAHLFWAGAWVVLGFKIWEIWDVWATPIRKDLVAGFYLQPPTESRPPMLAYRIEF